MDAMLLGMCEEITENSWIQSLKFSEKTQHYIIM